MVGSGRTAKLLAIGAFTAIAAGLADAQSFQGTVATLRTTEVWPGKNALYESVVKKIVEASEKVTPGSGFAIEVSALGPGSTYYAWSFYERFSDMRPEPLLVEAFGEDEAAAVVAMYAEAVKDTHVEAFVPRPDLSRPGEVPGYEVAWTVLVSVRPGMAGAYEDYLTQVVDAAAKVDADRAWFTYAPSAGAASTYRIVTPMRWVDLDAPPPSVDGWLDDAFGERRSSAIRESGQAAVERIESLLTIARPDLSYAPEPD